MIYDDIEFFNTEEINENGNILRFKESLILSLGNEKHQRGRFYGYRSIGAELRFVTESKFFDLKLRADKEDTKVYVFLGDYMHQTFVLKEGIVTNLHVEIPERFYNLKEQLPTTNFAVNVIRIVIGYSGYVSYIGLNTYGKRRPPKKEEVPSKALLLYGSSISHGSEALEYINSYAFLLSKLLHIDVLNKSIPGSCQAEDAMCDYLNTIKSDMAFVSLGVNVLGLYSLEDYQYHLNLLLDSLQADNVFYTSVLDNSNIFEPNSLGHQRMIQFREYAKSLKKFTYIDPKDILPEVTALTTDLLHPSDYGQLVIALNLYKILK